MSVIRLILLVVILGGLTLLLTQNWSPEIPLVFLGMRTQPLPLAMWMLLATTAGGLTTLFIMSLIKVSTYFVPEQRQTRYKSATRPRNQTAYKQPTPEPAPTNQTEKRASDTFDDWNTNNQDDDWNFDDNPQEKSASRQQTSEFSEPQTYERQQEPKSSSQSGSVYSYNYREPKNTAVGKTESVYDADYRVIVPPYQPPTTNQANDDEDDWSFFDDDEDFEDDKPRR
ncbi:LapA family protein [Calothrix sp. FACHB-1219]|uniref:LapA family protein n=1 Tax=unclassified Calothrix TaxID=2619626 RepID=UPI001687D3EB|nr:MULTISPECIES: LapA family protein [unclassified Calothrix]MBD2201436.1 LapA family protein [Calothrix sp. FACHB-168]MBD2215868.1 LapA family protein [Calothrix sp. FACHB-1219]